MRWLHTSRRHAAGPHVVVLLLLVPPLLQLVRLRGFAGAEMSGRQEMEMSVAQWPLRLRGGWTGVHNKSRAPFFRHAAPSGPVSMPSSRLWPPERFGEVANVSTPSDSARRNPYDVQPQRLRQRELDDAGQFSQRHTDYTCWGSQNTHAHASQGFARERASGTEVFRERRQANHGYGNRQGTVRDRDFMTPRLFSWEARARMQQREMLERRGSGRGIHETDNYEIDRAVPRKGARVHELLRRRLPSAPRPRQTTYPTRREPRDEQRWEWDDESRDAVSGSDARRALSHSFSHIPQHPRPQPRLHDRAVNLGLRDWRDTGEGPRGRGREPDVARYGGEELTRTRGCGGDPRMSSRVHERGREPRAGSWQLTDGDAHFTRPSVDRDGDSRRGRFALAGLPLLPHPVSSVEAAHSCTELNRTQCVRDQPRHSQQQSPTVKLHSVSAVGVPLTGTQTLVAAAGLSANASTQQTVKSWPDVASATSASVSASLRCSRATAGADEDKVAAMFNWHGLEVGPNAARPADKEAASTGQANFFAGGLHVTDDFLGAFGASVTKDQAENKAEEEAAAKGSMEQVLRNESEWSGRGVESSSDSSSGKSSGQSWAAGSGIKDLGRIKDLSSTPRSEPALGSDQAVASMTPDLPESLDLSKHSKPDTTPHGAVSRPDGWQPASQATLDASRGVRVSGVSEYALESFNRKRDIGGVGQETSKHRDGRSDSCHAASTWPSLASPAPRSRGISPQAASKVARSAGQGVSTDSEASVQTRESDVGVARERARSVREQAARAQDKPFFKDKWKTYRQVILNDRDGGGKGGIDGWTRSSADEKGTLHADASEEDSADGWARMCRLLLMPDSSESDYDEQMADIKAMFDEDQRFGTGWRGWEMREAEEQRLFARRCRDLRYVRLGDYWLDDWSGSSHIAQTDHRTLMPASREGDSSRSAADQGTESRVSSLTRHATSLIYGSMMSDGLCKTEPTEEALSQAENALETAIKESRGRFSPALNNLGALLAYRASYLANSSCVNVDPLPPAPTKSNLQRPGEERGHRICRSKTGTKCDHAGNMDGHASNASEIGKDEIDSDLAVLFDVPHCSASEENFAIDESTGEKRLATLDSEHLLELQEEKRLVALESWARHHDIQIPWQPLDQDADGGALIGKAAGGEDDEVTDSSEKESHQGESGGNGKRGEGEKRSRSDKAMTLSSRATDLLRTAMEQTPRYVTAMCNMAHLLSLNASTYLEAGMLHLQAREFSGVERVVDWWDPLPYSAPETVQGKGMDWPMETKASVHGHVFQPIEALNLHMEQVSLRMDEAIDAEERAREQDLDALQSEKDMAEEWGSADGQSRLVRSKAIKLTRRALAAAETAEVDFWKSKVQGDDDSESLSS